MVGQLRASPSFIVINSQVSLWLGGKEALKAVQKFANNLGFIEVLRKQNLVLFATRIMWASTSVYNL